MTPVNLNTLLSQLRTKRYNDINEFTMENISTWGKIVDIYDGDSCTIVLARLNGELQKFVCRLNGIDTPEMRPPLSMEERDTEIMRAYHARNRVVQIATEVNLDINSRIKQKDLRELICNNEKLVWVECSKFDKYGRLLVTIYPEQTEHTENNNYEEEMGFYYSKLSVNQRLINEEYAYEYHGGKKRS